MRVVTFGEIMLRLQPENHLRFMQEDKFEATFGGSEANVSICLANYGVNSEFVTKLPNNDIADCCIRQVRSFGVKTDNIVRGGERMGLYFIEKGASLRPSKVIYDRAHSAISEAASFDFDWDKIFDGATHFHFSGITPALSNSTAKITLDAVKQAKKRNIIVSCDFNYRANLWSKVEAFEVMDKILPYVDILIGVGEFEAKEILNIKGKSYEELAKKIIDKYKVKLIATNMRECRSADDNTIWATMFDGNKTYTSNKYDINIVDRVGGGDSFTAGLLYGLINKLDLAKALEIAVASSAIKHTISGDINLTKIDEVLSLVDGDKSGSVKR